MWHHRCVSERPPILTGERKAAWCGQLNEAVRLASSLPSDDLHDGVLAESHVAGDQLDLAPVTVRGSAQLRIAELFVPVALRCAPERVFYFHALIARRGDAQLGSGVD
jgi:hypothetical protein